MIKTKHHIISLQGKRNSNEDTEFIKSSKKISVWSIHDGHGGPFVSNFLKKNLNKYFFKSGIEYPLSVKYLRDVCDNLQNTLKKKHKDKAYHQGSTLLTVVLQKNKLKIMNVGDCRAVLCRDNLAIQLTKDHKPYWEDEKKRIKKLGGEIKKSKGDDWRICSLSVSRSFGDLDSHEFITHKPEIFNHTVTKKDNFLVMACDGLWDVMQNQEVIHYILEYGHKKNVALDLANYAISKGSFDNVTIIIIFFHN